VPLSNTLQSCWHSNVRSVQYTCVFRIGLLWAFAYPRIENIDLRYMEIKQMLYIISMVELNTFDYK